MNGFSPEVFCNRRLVWVELNTFVRDLELPFKEDIISFNYVWLFLH
jgi:hypothetical protein